jgi:hypothetical protein
MAIHADLTPSEAADPLAIRELFDAYAHCADRRDAARPTPPSVGSHGVVRLDVGVCGGARR